jgi:hypothetical protein
VSQRAQLRSSRPAAFPAPPPNDRFQQPARGADQEASIKGSEDVAEEFMAYRATLEAKLCWYRGIPVEIDHPLVPMELVPVRQLSQDDNVYEFLGSGWVPPPQGFLGTLSRLFSKRP